MPYLEWIEGRPEAATYDLGSSDLRREAPTSGVVPETLSELADPDDGVSLRAQVAETYDVDESNVLVTAGATHANFLAAATALALREAESDGESDGQETQRQVLVEKPGYQPLVATPEALGARVDRFLRPREGYPLEPDRIAHAMTEEVSLVSVTNRHNPSGHLTGRDTLSAAAETVAESGAYLLVDEVYAPYVETARSDGAFGGVTAAGLPNTVVSGSLTKFHGLGGLRVGWLVGPEPFVERAKQTKKHVPAVSHPSVALARRALHNVATLVEKSRAHLRENHARLDAFVEDRADLSGRVHDGCTFGFFSHEHADGDAVAEAAWEQGVLVVPGRFFDDTEGFRLSLGRGPDETEAGLSVLGEVLDGL